MDVGGALLMSDDRPICLPVTAPTIKYVCYYYNDIATMYASRVIFNKF